MVDDARRLEPLAETAAELLRVLANPDRLMIVCDLISGPQSTASLDRRLGIEALRLADALKALQSYGVLRTDGEGSDLQYRLVDIQAAEIVDALCSAFLGQDFSNRTRIPFRANRPLVGGHGKFGGANI